MPAHAVRDDEDAARQVGVDREVVLVAGSDHSDIRPSLMQKLHAYLLSRKNATAATTTSPTTIHTAAGIPPLFSSDGAATAGGAAAGAFAAGGPPGEFALALVDAPPRWPHCPAGPV